MKPKTNRIDRQELLVPLRRRDWKAEAGKREKNRDHNSRDEKEVRVVDCSERQHQQQRSIRRRGRVLSKQEFNYQPTRIGRWRRRRSGREVSFRSFLFSAAPHPRQHIIRLKHHVRRDAFFASANLCKLCENSPMFEAVCLFWCGAKRSTKSKFKGSLCNHAHGLSKPFREKDENAASNKIKVANIPGNPIMRSHPSQCSLFTDTHRHELHSPTFVSVFTRKQVERMQRVCNKSWVSEKRKLLTLHEKKERQLGFKKGTPSLAARERWWKKFPQ